VVDPADDVMPDTLALRAPGIPVTLSQLAALKGEALEIIDARVQVIRTLRAASIRATSPEDWVLFKAPDEHGGQIVGYLQDSGADRVRDLWGIEIFDISRPEKVAGHDPTVFHYLIAGSGRCKLTRQVVEAMEGGRSSTDDFCKGKTGAELELLVRKAARANLDGNITRELAGMKSVPIDDLRAAWNGTTKTVEHCRKGRGFGTRDERVGGASAKAPDVEPPVCPHCGTKGVYRPPKDGRPGFYGCPRYDTHKDKKFIVNADAWVAEQHAKGASGQRAGTPGDRPRPPEPVATGAPTAADVFGNKGSREPGQEG
jgi:hypothetical protein